jgi:hypothetical protein
MPTTALPQELQDQRRQEISPPIQPTHAALAICRVERSPDAARPTLPVTQKPADQLDIEVRLSKEPDESGRNHCGVTQ